MLILLPHSSERLIIIKKGSYIITDQTKNQKMCDQNMVQTGGIPVMHYPQIRGIAQPIRHLFYYLDKKFEEINNNNIRELEAGFNSGYPKLVQDEFELTDAIAIFRHLCRYYQRPDLLGLTPQNRAMINQFLFHYSEVRVKVIKKISEGARNSWGKQSQGQIYEIKLNVAKSLVEDECKILKQFLQMHMKNKGWIFGNLTIADFFFYQICFYLVNFLGSSLKNSLIYRNFENFLNMFESQDFFKANIDKIMAKKIFMPFKDKETSEIMTSFWQGDKLMVA